MQVREDFELLESHFVELDPLTDGFAGVLLEVHRHGDRYVLLEVAPATGDRFLQRWKVASLMPSSLATSGTEMLLWRPLGAACG